MSDEASNMEAIVKAARTVRDAMAGDRSDANVLARDLASCVIRQADEVARLRSLNAELVAACRDMVRIIRDGDESWQAPEDMLELFESLIARSEA